MLLKVYRVHILNYCLLAKVKHLCCNSIHWKTWGRGGRDPTPLEHSLNITNAQKWGETLPKGEFLRDPSRIILIQLEMCTDTFLQMRINTIFSLVMMYTTGVAWWHDCASSTCAGRNGGCNWPSHQNPPSNWPLLHAQPGTRTPQVFFWFLLLNSWYFLFVFLALCFLLSRECLDMWFSSQLMFCEKTQLTIWFKLTWFCLWIIRWKAFTAGWMWRSAQRLFMTMHWVQRTMTYCFAFQGRLKSLKFHLDSKYWLFLDLGFHLSVIVMIRTIDTLMRSRGLGI